MTTTDDLPVLPAIVDGSVWHRRSGDVHNEFSHRVYQWLVDLDDMPRLPWFLRPFASFDAHDHLGGTGTEATADLKANVQRFLAHRGIELTNGGRIVMLANARVLGHVFDPLSVFWCFEADGALRCVIAEVHNTYGDRHAYLLTPGDDGVAEVDKQLYVSPFFDVSGRYSMRFTVNHAEVGIEIALARDGRIEFEASLSGTATRATHGTIARRALTMPAMPQKVSALIRAHGIALWARRLPVVARPVHPRQEGV